MEQRPRAGCEPLVERLECVRGLKMWHLGRHSVGGAQLGARAAAAGAGGRPQARYAYLTNTFGWHAALGPLPEDCKTQAAAVGASGSLPVELHSPLQPECCTPSDGASIELGKGGLGGSRKDGAELRQVPVHWQQNEPEGMADAMRGRCAIEKGRGGGPRPKGRVVRGRSRTGCRAVQHKNFGSATISLSRAGSVAVLHALCRRACDGNTATKGNHKRY